MDNGAYVPSPAYLILPAFIDLIKITPLLVTVLFLMENKF